jgi:hypothetical protein
MIRYECDAYVCNNISVTGTTCGAGTSCPTTTHEFTPGFRVSWSLIFRVVFWTSFFALLTFFICPLYWLLIYDFLFPLCYLRTIYNKTDTIECGIKLYNQHIVLILTHKYLSYGSWIYNYLCNQWLSPLTLSARIPLRRGVLDTILCDNVCQWLAADWWFSLGILVSSINKTKWR